jgi:phage-related protein
MAYMPYNNYEGQYMAYFEVVFYEKENGDCPVEEFMNSLDVKMRAKMIGLLELLEEKGNQLREPYSKSIDDGIFEVRCKVGNNITRVLYFFYYEGKIVLTNGFVKKTQKIPPEEIKLAKERRADFKERMGKS